MGVIIPSVKTVEVLYLALLTVLLLARTVLSIKVSDVMGMNAASLVEMNKDKFIRGVVSLGLIAIPASIVNSLLKFFTSMLAIRFRKRLSRHIHEKYLSDMTFYKAADVESIDNMYAAHSPSSCRHTETPF
jgi:ATP-binding cassette, subfamily D (ALD), peroxisomal long-chain fatty acid import protein